MTERFKQEADSLKELRAIIRRADKLGFEPVEYLVLGEWETRKGNPVFIGATNIKVEKVGREYLHAEIDGETTPLVFGDGGMKDPGSVVVTLEGER